MLFAPLAVIAILSTVSARPVHYRRAFDFGKCGSPEIQFANGLDGRKEPSFQAIDQKDYNHGSALNIGVITSFNCQRLADTCKAPQATLDACKKGQDDAAATGGKDGRAADAYNAAFGIKTNFGAGAKAATPPAQQQQNPPAQQQQKPPAQQQADCPPPTTVTVTVSASQPSATAAPDKTDSNSGAAAPVNNGSFDFGSCSEPTIEFGAGFEGRKASENSFKPVNQNDYPQGSALNGNIVTNAVCNILKDRCKAPAATLTACDKGKADFAKLTGGAAADAFNAAFDIQTDFANIVEKPSIGKCSNPTIVFGPGFDGRKEDSFQPANKTDFNHSSALNGNIITKAICDTFVNTCNANAAAIANCATAQAAANGKSGQAFADAFNAAVTQGL